MANGSHRSKGRAWWHPVAIGALLVALLLTTVSCSSDGDDASPDTTGTTQDDGDGGGSGGEPTAGDPDGTDPLPALPEDVALPIVFVHGFAGSAQQYESQAMRYIANGYPAERILAYDHDGAGVDFPAYVEGVTETVDEALATFDVEQVYLVGHSRGPPSPRRSWRIPPRRRRSPSTSRSTASRVRTPCRARRPPRRTSLARPTSRWPPRRSPLRCSTSSSSARPLRSSTSCPSASPWRSPGRAVNFPENSGREAQLDIWPIDAETGARTTDDPHATFELGPDGEFGPVELETGAHYEYALSTEQSPVTHHLYLQPYLRSSHLVRLLSSPPDGPTRANTNTSADHTALIAIRMREWYGQSDNRDVLQISVDGGEPVDAVTDFIGNEAIGLHIHDDAATPGESTLEPLPYFADQPFQSGIDVAIPDIS